MKCMKWEVEGYLSKNETIEHTASMLTDTTVENALLDCLYMSRQDCVNDFDDTVRVKVSLIMLIEEC